MLLLSHIKLTSQSPILRKLVGPAYSSQRYTLTIAGARPFVVRTRMTEARSSSAIDLNPERVDWTGILGKSFYGRRSLGVERPQLSVHDTPAYILYGVCCKSLDTTENHERASLNLPRSNPYLINPFAFLSPPLISLSLYFSLAVPFRRHPHLLCRGGCALPEQPTFPARPRLRYFPSSGYPGMPSWVYRPAFPAIVMALFGECGCATIAGGGQLSWMQIIPPFLGFTGKAGRMDRDVCVGVSSVGSRVSYGCLLGLVDSSQRAGGAEVTSRKLLVYYVGACSLRCAWHRLAS
ncbi:hypothetical protein R3P38DRAFT_3222111 [Favolaschia claudopus]|uniref:Uncharacterized protein n=1 Tax=Favolaschia claudopus TaxID=2862362 RepID=A0AAV9ZZ11_9AGAR